MKYGYRQVSMMPTLVTARHIHFPSFVCFGGGGGRVLSCLVGSSRVLSCLVWPRIVLPGPVMSCRPLA